MGVDDAADAHPAAGDLLDHQRVGQQRLAQTAVLLGDHEAEQPHLLHALDDVRRVGVVALERRDVRQDLLVHEPADGLDDLLLHVGQTLGLGETTHGATPRLRGDGGRFVTGEYAPVRRAAGRRGQAPPRGLDRPAHGVEAGHDGEAEPVVGRQDRRVLVHVLGEDRGGARGPAWSARAGPSAPWTSPDPRASGSTPVKKVFRASSLARSITAVMPTSSAVPPGRQHVRRVGQEAAEHRVGHLLVAALGVRRVAPGLDRDVVDLAPGGVVGVVRHRAQLEPGLLGPGDAGPGGGHVEGVEVEHRLAVVPDDLEAEPGGCREARLVQLRAPQSESPGRP